MDQTRATPQNGLGFWLRPISLHVVWPPFFCGDSTLVSPQALNPIGLCFYMLLTYLPSVSPMKSFQDVLSIYLLSGMYRGVKELPLIGSRVLLSLFVFGLGSDG